MNREKANFSRFAPASGRNTVAGVHGKAATLSVRLTDAYTRLLPRTPVTGGPRERREYLEMQQKP
jgi:hypothetical protein